MVVKVVVALVAEMGVVEMVVVGREEVATAEETMAGAQKAVERLDKMGEVTMAAVVAERTAGAAMEVAKLAVA